MTSSQVLQGVHKLLYTESKKSELLFELCVKHDLLDLHLDGGSFLRRQSFEGRDVAQEKQLVLVEGLLLVFLRRAVEVAWCRSERAAASVPEADRSAAAGSLV